MFNRDWNQQSSAASSWLHIVPVHLLFAFEFDVTTPILWKENSVTLLDVKRDEIPFFGLHSRTDFNDSS